MIVTTDQYDGKRKVTFAQYASVNDFATQLGKSKFAAGYDRRNDYGWAGGSVADTLRDCERGDEQYAREAEKWIDRFSNVALEQYALDLEHNTQFGMVDVGAWMAGEPEHLCGPTFTPTDRAPIAITMDQWIWCGIKTRTIKRRGVAAMALLQALSLFRPVMLYVVLANRHVPSRTDCIQVIPAPTTPMDTSRTGVMVAAPRFVRSGMMPMLHEHAKSDAPCSIPALQAGLGWQTHKLARWLAPRLGVDDDNIIHLPAMQSPQEFGNDRDAQAWVTKWVKHYADT